MYFFNKTKIFNILAFDKTKKIDDSEYYHENVLKNDDEDESDSDEEDDDDDNDEENDDMSKYQEKRRRKRHQAKKAFNQTTSTTIESEFNTPLNRRSRSLMSLRRRHWSASSNRSASNHNLTALNTVNSRNKFVNSENREQRRLFSNDDQDSNTNYNTRSYNTRTNLNKSSSSQCISNATKPSNRLKTCSNYQSAPNFNQTSKIRISRTVTRTTTTTFQIKQQQQESKKSMNVSAISFKGLNRLSRNLRKSFNEIYTPNKTSDNKRKSRRTAESQPSQEDLDDSKENHNSTKAAETKSQSKSSPSKYAKRLRRFKNTILKSSLFSKKKSSSRTTSKNKIDELNVSKSMPDLNKIDLCDEKEESPAGEITSMKTNQSFVNNVKSKLSNLKRNKYFNNETNIEAKRPKFY